MLNFDSKISNMKECVNSTTGFLWRRSFNIRLRSLGVPNAINLDVNNMSASRIATSLFINLMLSKIAPDRRYGPSLKDPYLNLPG